MKKVRRRGEDEEKELKGRWGRREVVRQWASTVCRGLETWGIEALGPISQMRKLRLTEAQPVAAARSTWRSYRSHLRPLGEVICAWKAKYPGLFRASGMFCLYWVREVGIRGMCSQFRTEETSNWRGPSLTFECPQACWLPLQGWEVLESLSYHAKEGSFYFYFAKRGFSMKWMLNVIKCLFIIPGFSLLAY